LKARDKHENKNKKVQDTRNY